MSVFRTVAAKKGSIYPSRRAFTAAKHASKQSTVLLALPWYNGMPKLTSVLEKERVRAFTAQNSTVSPPRRASTVAQCSKTPVYGSMGSELVEKDPKTNVNSGLGLWRSRGPERFPDHLRKDSLCWPSRRASVAACCSSK